MARGGQGNLGTIAISPGRAVVKLCPEYNPTCLACTGEACDLCGAGSWNTDPGRPHCEHDVIERHTRLVSNVSKGDG